MTPRMEWRQVRIYKLPLDSEVALLRPEQAIVQFPNNARIDVGALCYLQRITPTVAENANNSDKGRKVVLNSLCRKRAKKVAQLIHHLSEEIRSGCRRMETVRSNISRFMSFMAWADENGRHDILEGGASLSADLRAYLHFIRDRVARNEISLNTGAMQQKGVVVLLEEFLQVDDLSRGMYLLTADKHSKQGTAPPSDEAQGKVLSLCRCIFQSLSSLSLETLPYPHAMPTPGYLHFPQNRLWVFPCTSWFKTPSMLLKKRQWGACINYTEGRLATIDEVTELGLLKNPGDQIRTARRRLNAANANPDHPARRQAAMTAAAAYLIMFVAETGMNWAQVMEMTWVDDYETIATHQAFRTIKWRAGGKPVSFELPVEALPSFRRYLELRKYILKGLPFAYLFFSMSSTEAEAARQLTLRLNTTYQMLRRIDPALPKVMPREWRAAKSDWLVRNTDAATAALVLQNSERTILQSYAEGAESDHAEEMGLFLGQLSSTILSPDQAVETETARPVGNCSAFGEPATISPQVMTVPDCRSVEGCLHCDKFKVHADERDTRKLLSCRHVLRRTAGLLGDDERQNQLIGPHLKRIDVILDELTRRDAAMVARTEKEVDEEGELDKYWARKLEMLIELGVLN